MAGVARRAWGGKEDAVLCTKGGACPEHEAFAHATWLKVWLHLPPWPAGRAQRGAAWQVRPKQVSQPPSSL